MSRQQVPNAEVGRDTARANLLVNGGFEIWQRGNGPFSVSGAYSADRWGVSPIGTDGLSVARSTSNLDLSSNYSAQVNYVLGTGAGQTQLFQVLKLAESAYVGKQLTLSMRVLSNIAAAVRLGIYNGSVWTYGSYHTGDSTWQTLSVTSPAAVNAFGIQLGVMFSATVVAYLDNAMLVVGTVPADYAPLHPADDLARCLRYYQRYGLVSNATLALGQAATATLSFHPFRLPVWTAVTPTVTVTAAANFATTGSGGANLACTALVSTVANTQDIRLDATVASGLVAGNATWLSTVGTGGLISVEANS